MLLSLVLIPTVLALTAFVTAGKQLRALLLLTGSGLHLVLVLLQFINPVQPAAQAWLGLDALGLLFLLIVSLLFLASSIYAAGYLADEKETADDGSLVKGPQAVFTGCLLLFLAAMSLVCLSRDMGLLWVAVEATTLVSAPLISYHRHHRSLEATWKYLLICSVGIAMALLGNFFLIGAAGGNLSLHLATLTAKAASLNPLWLKAAFVMLLVGYGTKMGLAPMHTWLPDAHSESPSMVSALLSGALLNSALLGVLRSHSVMQAAGLGKFSGGLLVFFGILSMGTAAVFLVHQLDYKRLLAYSSVEHIGIVALGVGVGSTAAGGAMLHALGHSMIKALLFLTAGEILRLWHTKHMPDVRGLLKRNPAVGIGWLAGFLAVAGLPPFSLFISELTILRELLIQHRWLETIFYLLALGIVAISITRMILPMVLGQGRDTQSHAAPGWYLVPVIFLGLISLALGTVLPEALNHFLQQAAQCAGGLP